MWRLILLMAGESTVGEHQPHASRRSRKDHQSMFSVGLKNPSNISSAACKHSGVTSDAVMIVIGFVFMGSLRI